jgi:hypothetical protein
MTIELQEKYVELPHVPSVLIRLAIRDLEKARANPKCKIQMGDWCQTDWDGRCHLCAAGAVMKFGMENSPVNGDVDWGKISIHNNSALSAINQFRRGYASNGCKELSIRTEVLTRVIRHCWHSDCNESDQAWQEFKEDMLQLAADFEAEGN